MGNIQYFYLGKDYRSKKIDEETFKAYKYKDKDTKKVILYPIVPSFNDEFPTEIFIYGVGRKKIGKNIIEVPVFDNNFENWNKYLDKYGVYCLFYSIDGTEYNTQDCCWLNRQMEFRSILKYGIEDYIEFINNFSKLYDIQLNTIRNKYLPLMREYNCVWGKDETLFREYCFSPCYNMVYSFITTKYSVDVLSDDKRMEKLYKDYRKADLRSKSVSYKEYRLLEEKRIDMYKKLCEKYGNYLYGISIDEDTKYCEIKDKAHKLFLETEEKIDKQIDIEINTDNDIFPTSVKDRIKYLFGEDATKIYTYLIETFI